MVSSLGGGGGGGGVRLSVESTLPSTSMHFSVTGS